jgi:hypothetical protein
MPDPVRKLVGILLILVAIGVASSQALLASCASTATVGGVQHSVVAPDWRSAMS